MEDNMTKTEQALKYFKEENYKKALAIFKTFKIGFSNEESKQICRAYECMTNSRFYSQMFNCDEEITKGIEIVRNYIRRKYES